MQEGTRLFGILPFLLYTVLQVALFVFRILLLHSDRLSGYRLHIFHKMCIRDSCLNIEEWELLHH